MSEARDNPEQPVYLTPDEREYYSKQKEGSMHLSDVRTSRYLKKEDIGKGQFVTIEEVKKENVATDGADPEYKVVLQFKELEKPLVLNTTNATMIAKITGHEQDIDKNWIGKKIVLYVDENVTMHGKLVGGIRVRAPKPGAVQPEPEPEEDDPLPF